MTPADHLVHYLLGVPEGVPDAPMSVEIPRTYRCEDDARAELGTVMLLSRMTHGDVVADSTSWYLQSAITFVGVPPGDGDFYYGYRVHPNVVHPIAGGWKRRTEALRWRPFVAEMEMQRAHQASLPWHRDMLQLFSIEELVSGLSVDSSLFRTQPTSIELLVRPVDMYVTEPLF